MLDPRHNTSLLRVTCVLSMIVAAQQMVIVLVSIELTQIANTAEADLWDGTDSAWIVLLLTHTPRHHAICAVQTPPPYSLSNKANFKFVFSIAS